MEITKATAEKAAHIRADFSTFKSMDAMQLAAAKTNGCDVFLTNDMQLRQFSGIQCCMVEDWSGQKG
ncbi:MAG: PIN domain-containing protein [Selenomonadaceae bacterium]|nr:PIN domain-containing protein [Selenomonadaceae bacterium]